MASTAVREQHPYTAEWFILLRFQQHIITGITHKAVDSFVLSPERHSDTIHVVTWPEHTMTLCESSENQAILNSRVLPEGKLKIVVILGVLSCRCERG